MEISAKINRLEILIEFNLFATDANKWLYKSKRLMADFTLNPKQIKLAFKIFCFQSDYRSDIFSLP